MLQRTELSLMSTIPRLHYLFHRSKSGIDVAFGSKTLSQVITAYSWAKAPLTVILVSMHDGCLEMASRLSLLTLLRSQPLFKSLTLPHFTSYPTLSPTSEPLLHSQATSTTQTYPWRTGRVMTRFAFSFLSVGAFNGCQRRMGRDTVIQ